MANHRLNWRKRLLFTAVVVVLGLCCIEGICRLLWLPFDYARFRVSRPRAAQFLEEFHTQHDPELGWVNIPGKHIARFYGPDRDITINRDGFRGLEDYLGKKPSDKFRLVCLGDSFTLGYGVDDRLTYPAQLQNINPAVQAVNMGQGGYSIGQCYLWYKRVGPELDADGIVLAFVLDDLWRMMGTRMANGYAKPRFEIRDGRIHVTGIPVPQKIETGAPMPLEGATMDFLVEQSAIMHTLAQLAGRRSQRNSRQAAEQVEIAMAMIGELSQDATQRGIPLVLVLMPELVELQDAQRSFRYQQGSSSFAKFARREGIPFLDVHDAFSRAEPQVIAQLYLQEHWQHFSESGNRLVASEINALLAKTIPSYPANRSADAVGVSP